MARIEFGKAAKPQTAGTSFGGVKIPWKALILIVLIGTSWYAIYAQYKSYQPRPVSQPRGSRGGGGDRPPPDMGQAMRRGFENNIRRIGNGNQQRNQWMTAVGLTEEQKAKVATIQKETTDTRERTRRYTEEVMTPEQKTKFEAYRAEQRNRGNRNRGDRNTTGTQGARPGRPAGAASPGDANTTAPR